MQFLNADNSTNVNIYNSGATDVADIGSSAKPVLFGDFRRGYMIVDRTTLSVMRDPFTQATSGNVRYIARRRIGGQVILPEAIQILQCGA